MTDIILTPKALADLDKIADYTLEVWGEKRLREFMANFDRRLDLLKAFPETGLDRSDVRFGLRMLVFNKYLIFSVARS